MACDEVAADVSQLWVLFPCFFDQAEEDTSRSCYVSLSLGGNTTEYFTWYLRVYLTEACFKVKNKKQNKQEPVEILILYFSVP